jgi:hypothetical protein
MQRAQRAGTQRAGDMEIAAWALWALLALLGVLWTVVWFLVSGWVSTLLQIALLVVAVFFFKYGWQRAPAELWRRARSVGGLFWAWMRAREPKAASAPGVEVREVVRVVRVKEFGDVNVSTLLSLLALLGFVLLAGL